MSDTQYLSLVFVIFWGELIYTKDPAHENHEIATFNNKVNSNIQSIDTVFFVVMFIATIILIIIACFIFPDPGTHTHHSSRYYRHYMPAGALLLIIIFTAIATIIRRAYTIHTLIHIEENLYKAHVGTLVDISSLSLNADNINTYSLKDVIGVFTLRRKLTFILRNVPPCTINDKHVQPIIKLLPKIDDDYHFTYKLRCDYHHIPPYGIQTFNTPEDVDKLLDYLGTQVKQSPHSYKFFSKSRWDY